MSLHNTFSEIPQKKSPIQSLEVSDMQLVYFFLKAYNSYLKQIMERDLGYSIELRQSKIPGAGVGVFISKGKATKGSIVGFYPGSWVYFDHPKIML